jgi:hypothetical protein
VTREPIYAALFAHFAALAAADGSLLFKTATRIVKHWADVPPEEEPALLLLPRSEHAQRRKGLPTIWTLNADLLVYVNTAAQENPAAIPAQILNPLLDAIEGSLAIDDVMNNACTLGGLVSHCAIDGDIELHLGSLGNEAVAIVPLQLLTSP